MRAIKQITPRLDATIIAREVILCYDQITFSISSLTAFFIIFLSLFISSKAFSDFSRRSFTTDPYSSVISLFSFSSDVILQKKRCFLIQLKLKHWRFSFTVKNMLKITKLKIDWQKLFSYLSLLKPIEKRLRRR